MKLSIQEKQMKCIWGLAFLIMLFFPVAFVKPILDNDGWFILNNGRYILEQGFTGTEPFSLHEGLDFMFNKWLTDVSMYAIYDHFGMTGLYGLMCAASAISTLLIYKIAGLVSQNRLVNMTCSMALGFILTLFYITTRPQMFSILLLLAELYILERYAVKKQVKLLFLLPALSALYINFHSTMWLAFFILMIPYIFQESVSERIHFNIKYDNYKRIPLILAFLASLGAGLCNPYGYRMFTYIFSLYQSESATSDCITELRPACLTNSMMVWILVALVILMTIYNLQRGMVLNGRYFTLFLGTLFMQLCAVRNSLFLLIACAVVLPHVLYRAGNLCGFHINRIKQFILGAGVFCTCLFLSVSYFTHVFQTFDSYMMKRTMGYEASEYLYEYLGDEVSTAKVFTTYNNGGYSEFLGMRCYMDSRSEVYCIETNHKREIMNEYWQFAASSISYQELQQMYGFDYWLINQNNSHYTYMKQDPCYEVLFESVFDEDNPTNAYAALKYVGGEKHE